MNAYEDDVNKDVEDVLALVAINTDVDVDSEEDLDSGVDGNNDIVAGTEGTLDTIYEIYKSAEGENDN